MANPKSKKPATNPQLEDAKTFREAIRKAKVDTVKPLDDYYQKWANQRVGLDEGFLKINAPDGETIGEKLKKNPQYAINIQTQYKSLLAYNAPNNPTDFKLIDYQKTITSITDNLNSANYTFKSQSNLPLAQPIPQGEIHYYDEGNGQITYAIETQKPKQFINKQVMLEPGKKGTFTDIEMKNHLTNILKDAQLPLPNAPDIHAAQIQNLKNSTKKEIEAKQQKELDAFEKQFSDQMVQQALNTNSVDEAKTFKQSLLSALKEKHAKELEAFEKQHDEVLKGLYKHLNSEMARISSLKQLADKNRKVLGIGEQSVEAAIKGNPDLSLIDPTKIETFKSLSNTNRTVTFDALNNAYKVSWKKYESWIAALPGIDGFEKDMETLALAIREQGHDEITFEINSQDVDREGRPTPDALKNGRQAYEGALRAGFDPEKIAIKINGKEYKRDELFNGHKNTLDTLLNRARDHREHIEQHIDTVAKNLPGA